MRTIHKYLLPGQVSTVTLPVGAQFRFFGMQGSDFFVWFEVDTDEKYREQRVFELFGTGWDIPRSTDHYRRYDYLGTTQSGLYVWHLYEVKGRLIHPADRHQEAVRHELYAVPAAA